MLVLSLTLSNVLRFRALNLLASLVLTVFNAALGVWPMVAMNAAIVGINAWHLVRLLRTRDDERTYEVVAVDPRAEYLAHLLRVHAADVERHNPGFDLHEVLRPRGAAGDVPGRGVPRPARRRDRRASSCCATAATAWPGSSWTT